VSTYTVTEGLLTKRELFAAMAMQGLLWNNAEINADEVAEWAIAQADALLDALGNRSDKTMETQ
jgi:hypothetical protein